MARRKEILKTAFDNLKREFSELETLLTKDDRGEWIAFPERDAPEVLDGLSPSLPGPVRAGTSQYYLISCDCADIAAAFPAGEFSEARRRDATDVIEIAAAPCGDFELQPPGAFTEKLKMAARYSMKMAETEYASLHDSLTGVHNKAYFDRSLRSGLAWLLDFFKSASRNDHALESAFTGRNLGLIIFDIDNFKSFNDVFGHRAGDEVLRETASACEKAVSVFHGDAVLCRYGGEEFAVIVQGRSTKGIREIAETVRRTVENIDNEAVSSRLGLSMKLRRVTVSVGFSTHCLYTQYSCENGNPDPDQLFEAMIGKADMALYAAKRLGKNRVVSFGEIRQECSFVIDTIGSSAMVTAGYATGAAFGDSFVVYDSKYDGKSEIVDPATSKKIGVYPKFVKGTLRIEPDFTKFDNPLMERVSMCEISESSATRVASGDRCFPLPRKDSVLYNDLFLPAAATGISNYAAPLKSDEMEEAGAAFLISARDAFEELRTKTGGESAGNFFAAFSLAAEAVSSGALNRRLSSDKALLIFKKRADIADVERKIAARFEDLSCAFNIESRIHVSSMTSAQPSGTIPGDAERRLRITDLCGRFFGSTGIFRYGPEAHRNFGRFLYLCGMTDEALAELLECERFFGRESDPALLQYIGNVAMTAGDMKMAEKYLIEAEGFLPENVPVLCNIALLNCINGDFEKAASYYDKCCRLEPANAVHLNNLAFVIKASGGDLARARAIAEKALSLCAAEQKANFTDTLAEIYSASGDHAGAAALYEDIVKMTAFCPPVKTFLNLSGELLACSDTAGAWKAIRRARSHHDAETVAKEIDRLIDSINLARHSN